MIELILISVGVAIVLAMSFLVYTSRFHISVKMFVYPLLIVAGTSFGYHYIDNLGAPLERPLPLEFDYTHHVIEGETILVWLKTEERGHRLHKIPYVRETAKKLEEAGEMQERGGNPRVTGTERVEEAGTRVLWEVDNHIPEESLAETK